MANDTLSHGVAYESSECIVEIPKGSRNKYEQLENKKVEVEGWFSREDAIEEIEASRRRFSESDGSPD